MLNPRDLAPAVAIPAVLAAYFFGSTVDHLSLFAHANLFLMTLLVWTALLWVWTKDLPYSRARWIILAITAPPVLIFLLMAQGAQKDDIANDKRCEAIQRDMLSQHPLRDDGPDLFQALGCRPQGEGSVHAPPSEAMIEVHEWLPWGG